MAVKEKVKGILVDHLGVDESGVTPDSTIVDDLGADSLDCVEIVMELESSFNIEITDEDAEKFVYVRDITAYVEKALVKKK